MGHFFKLFVKYKGVPLCHFSKIFPNTTWKISILLLGGGLTHPLPTYDKKGGYWSIKKLFRSGSFRNREKSTRKLSNKYLRHVRNLHNFCKSLLFLPKLSKHDSHA